MQFCVYSRLFLSTEQPGFNNPDKKLTKSVVLFSKDILLTNKNFYCGFISLIAQHLAKIPGLNGH